MKTETLLNISIISSLIGIGIILFMVENLDLKVVDISSITKNQVDQRVKIIGEINSIKNTLGLMILDVKDSTGNIDIIIFKEENYTIKKGEKVEIEGTVTEYKGTLELTAKRIKNVS